MKRRLQRYVWIAGQVDWREVAQLGSRYWDRYDRASRSGRHGRTFLIREILMELMVWLERRT